MTPVEQTQVLELVNREDGEQGRQRQTHDTFSEQGQRFIMSNGGRAPFNATSEKQRLYLEIGAVQPRGLQPRRLLFHSMGAER